MIFKKELKKAPLEISNTIHIFHKFFEFENEDEEK